MVTQHRILDGQTVYETGAGVYNGAGVYKDGEGGGDIIYETDFSNFDFANKIDYPQTGAPKEFTFDSSKFEKTTVTIDGVIYPTIKHKTGSSYGIFDADFTNELNGLDLYTIEATAYKPSWVGTGGVMQYYRGSEGVGSPSINCWIGDRGYGVRDFPTNNVLSYYNNFRLLYETYFFSTQDDIRNTSGICNGGATFDVTNNLAKVYLKNKKALICNMGKKELFRFYADPDMEWYLLGLKITKTDLFEEME